MSASSSDRTVEKLLRQQAALAAFGSFAFREPGLLKILTEAARICAASLDVPFCKICRYRAAEHDLLIEAGWSWHLGVVGRVVSQADEGSPQGRAYVTEEPVIIRNLHDANNLNLPAFYREHGIVSTVDVVIPAIDGGTVARLGVRLRSPSVGMDRWLAGTSVRSRTRACHYRQRTEPGAAGRLRVATSASAVTCSSGGSPGSWPSLR